MARKGFVLLAVVFALAVSGMAYVIGGFASVAVVWLSLALVNVGSFALGRYRARRR